MIASTQSAACIRTCEEIALTGFTWQWHDGEAWAIVSGNRGCG